jgi:2-polyprenyl-3-methyl-5-hydroxy-6-metoxy-1,4-benzoquinol methylase
MLVGLSLARKIIEDRTFRERRAVDLGCGNGSISNLLSQLGFEVIGVDPFRERHYHGTQDLSARAVS